VPVRVIVHQGRKTAGLEPALLNGGMREPIQW
jgi:hypothetical protein